jgi:hypothetical protein
MAIIGTHKSVFPSVPKVIKLLLMAILLFDTKVALVLLVFYSDFGVKD